MGHLALCGQVQATTQVAVQVGFGQRGEPFRMAGVQGRAAQGFDLGRWQAVQAVPVFMVLGLRQLRQKVAQQLAAFTLATRQFLVQRLPLRKACVVWSVSASTPVMAWYSSR